MKKVLVFFLFILSWFVAYSQQLSLGETIKYINNMLEEGSTLSLSNDGKIEYKCLDHYVKKYPKTYQFHISDVFLGDVYSLGTIDNEYCLSIDCKSEDVDYFPYFRKNNCIKKIEKGENANVTLIVIFTMEGDKYSAQKLWNALNYLFSLAKRKGMDKRVDDDPFAPNNYNPSALEIKSLKDKGSIQLTRHGGMYFIPVSIGNISEDFVLDSGASDVSISVEMERKLIQNGIIKKTDYLENGLYKIANGSIVECRRLIIPKLTIGDFTIENVQASVGIGESPLLFGKSVLDKFSKWSINNLTQTLDVEK